MRKAKTTEILASSHSPTPKFKYFITESKVRMCPSWGRKLNPSQELSAEINHKQGNSVSSGKLMLTAKQPIGQKWAPRHGPTQPVQSPGASAPPQRKGTGLYFRRPLSFTAMHFVRERNFIANDKKMPN
jgi:hypothetical protein